MILPHAACVVDMSMTSGGSRPAGAPNAIGLEPRKMRFMPGGTMIESVCVRAMPTMPSRAAASTKYAHAPQWELLWAAATPTPDSRASVIASCMARSATTWPMPAPPSTTALDGPVRRTRISGLALIVPLRRRVA